MKSTEFQYLQTDVIQIGGNAMRKDRMLGFLGIMGLQGISGVLHGDWLQATWLVWFVWFLHFIPNRNGSSKE